MQKKENLAAREEFDVVEHYFEQEVTDGLPVVPPTESKMAHMLAATKKAADDVIALVPPNFGEATVEKIAVNSVMAGCKPEYFPVVVAGVAEVGHAVLRAHTALPGPFSEGKPVAMRSDALLDSTLFNHVRKCITPSAHVGL